MLLTSPVLRWISIAAVAAYAVIFVAHAFGAPTYGVRFLQQTLLSVGLCGFISSGIVGFRGRLGKLLEQPALLRIGQLSYGIYLFHNLAPLVAGKLMPFLWNGAFESGILALLKVSVFAGLTWGMALASWHWIELPLQDLRTRMGKR
jgi:peptidoglycan/LPS O-acetylase OafA/YrhL